MRAFARWSILHRRTHTSNALPLRHFPFARRGTHPVRLPVRRDPHGPRPVRPRPRWATGTTSPPSHGGACASQTARSHRTSRGRPTGSPFLLPKTDRQQVMPTTTVTPTSHPPRHMLMEFRQCNCRRLRALSTALFRVMGRVATAEATQRGGGAVSSEPRTGTRFGSRPRVAGRCGPDRHRFSSSTKWPRVRTPLGASRAPVAQSVEHFRAVITMTAAVRPSATHPKGGGMSYPHRPGTVAEAHAPPVDDWTRLRRFLILGSEGGTLLRERADARRARTRRRSSAASSADGARAVARDRRRLSDGGRAPKNDPALFALAMAAGAGDAATRQAALDALPRVAARARTCSSSPTFVEGFRGWGRSLRRAVGTLVRGPARRRARLPGGQVPPRDGWAHRDLLRLAHPAGACRRQPVRRVTPEHARLFEWIVRGGVERRPAAHASTGFVARAGGADARPRRRSSSREYRLPREAVRPEHLDAPDGVGGAARATCR